MKKGFFILEKEISLPQGLLDDFKFNKEHIDIFSSEASRSELIISPLLRTSI